MSDLAAFLTARLDEDEAAAKAAWGTEWDWRYLVSPFREPCSTAHTVHIARHDPARVLRGVEAKRKILAEHPVDAELLSWSLGATEVVAGRQPPMSICLRCHIEVPDAREDEDACRHEDWPCPTLRALAGEWSDHADYDQAWAC